MRFRLRWLVAAVLSLMTLTPACGSSDSSSKSSDSGQPACLAGLDAGFVNGPESLSEDGGCGNLLTGTKQAGDACQHDSECASICCACPSGGKSAEVAWCNAGKCVVGAESCCAFLAAGMNENEGGIPYACQAH